MITNARHYATDALLRDGSSIHLRAIRPDDQPRLLAFFSHLSSRSMYLRFFRAKTTLTDEELRYFTELDFVRNVALVATPAHLLLVQGLALALLTVLCLAASVRVTRRAPDLSSPMPAARVRYPQFVNFSNEYPSIVGLTWQARALDRRLLSSLERSAWPVLPNNRPSEPCMRGSD